MAGSAVAAVGSVFDLRKGALDEELDVEQARDALLLSSLSDAIVIGIALLGLAAFAAPISHEVIAAVCLFGTAPLILAIVTLGLANVRVPYLTITLASASLLLGAYITSDVASFSDTPLPLALISLMCGLALLPQFVALWSSSKLAAKDEGKTIFPCDATSFSAVGVLAMITAIVCVGYFLPPYALDPRVSIGIYLVASIPPIIANWIQARADRRLPVKRGDKQPDHISGLGASTFILFVLVVVTLGLWAAATGIRAEISTYAGLIVLVGLVVAFGIVAFGLPASRRLSSAFQFLKWLVKPIGWLFSTVDSLLVFAVANALGANANGLIKRFTLMLGAILPCAALGWWLPHPYGLVPLGLALVGTISIARRWAWVEEDRENAMLARRFEGDHIRVGFSQDLKDEALVGFALLFLIVPIALRQLHMSFNDTAFQITPVNDRDHLLAWLSFFGTEMAKAVPFVDWTEIYQVNGASSIKLGEETIGIGQHIVFGMRILVDLVLLSAFLQAISITQRTRKLKDMFYVEESLNRLDPFIEPGELRKLVRSTSSGFEIIEEKFKDFPIYDPDRLEELKQKGDQDSVGYVAARLLERDEEGGPEEQLSREARRDQPSMEKCTDLLAEVSDTPLESLQIGPLKAARYALSRLASFRQIRHDITEQIVRALPLNERVNALSEILIGPAPGVQDPRQQVRAVALNGLFRPALEGNRVAQASIRHAAAHDPAAAIKNSARQMLEYSSEW